MPRSWNGEVQRCSVSWGTTARAGWDRATLPWTPLSLFFSGDTAAGPRDCRMMRSSKPSALSSPPEPFWLIFSFPFFLGGWSAEGVFIFNFALQLVVGWEAAFDQEPRSERRGQRKLEIAVVCPMCLIPV